MKKLTYNHVKLFIENNKGYKLLSTEYINSKEKLSIKCPENHIFQITYNDFQSGCRCSVCFGKHKYTYEQVKQYIEDNEYKLLSKKYINNKEKLKIICNNGHIVNMSFESFKNGHHRCIICSGKQKYTYEYIKSFIENEGYELLSNEYKNNNTKLELKCPENHIFQMCFSDFKVGHRCSICFGTHKHSHSYVKSFIEQNGYKLLSDEYENNHEKLKIQCNKKHNFNMRFNNFQRGQRCPICSTQKNTSIPEKEVAKFVKENYNGIIIENDRATLRNPLTGKMLELDVYLPELNKAIEFNGVYYHDNEKQKCRDEQKIIQSKKKNIDLLIIEEKDWTRNKQNCLNIINNFIGIKCNEI